MLAEGQIIGNYRIVRKLGEGGMGAVFEAVHQEIGRRAAVKVLHSQFAQNAQVAQRFLNEAKAANLVEHPGVVEIFEFSRLPDGTTYIVMEYLKGEPLAKRLERGPLGLDTLRISRQIASVLSAAHEQGIIHRDLKPDNVIIVKDPEAPGGERAKVLDFGIAKIAEESVMKTQAGSVLGTPAYMAPEQCKGAALVTDKSDVYALGIMMYEMLSGRVPFTGTGLGDIMIAHLTQEPTPLKQIAPDVSGELAAFVHRLLAKDPTTRPTMRQVIDQLEHLGAARTGVMILPASAAGDLSGRNISAASDRQIAAPDVKTIMGDAPPPKKGGGTMALEGSDNSAMPKAAHPQTAMLPGGPPGPPPDRTRMMLFGVLGALGLGIAVVLVLLLKPSGTPKPPPATPDLGSGAGATNPKKNDPTKSRDNRRYKGEIPAGMVFVPGGPFDMGSTPAEIDAAFKLCEKRGIACAKPIYEREQPKRTVNLRDIFIDQTEVSNADFAKWLATQQDFKVQKKRQVFSGKTLIADLAEDKSGIEFAKAGKGTTWKARDGFGEKPAVLVTWHGAQLYCTAQGKRLPSEAEWELAARGRERRVFPWGDEPPKCDGTVFGRAPEIPEDRRCADKDLVRAPQKAGSASQDRTPQGVLDLGGNVAEWVQDVYAERYPECEGECKNPVNEEAAAAAPGKADKKAKGKGGGAVLRVVRGGHFDLPADACRGAGRSKLAEEAVTFKLGFRCVRSLPE